MTNDELEQGIEAFLGNDEPELKPGLSGILYSMEELRMWPDYVDSVSEEQCLLCWKIVEALRKKEFPDDLCM